MRATITNKQEEMVDISGFWAVTMETRERRRREVVGLDILVVKYVMSFESDT